MSNEAAKVQVAIEATSNLAQTATADKKAVDDLSKSTIEATKEEQKQTETTSSLELKKRELSEAIHGLTRQYPLLGEAARAAFNPMVASIAGIIEAFTIFQERMQSSMELMGAFELPDMDTHATGVSAAAEAYDHLKTAVADANTEFNSGTSIYERQATAIKAQLTATNLLIAAEKKKAEADLDVQRATGQITSEQYYERRAAIEKDASKKTEDSEITARNNELMAKRAEIDTLGKQSAEETAKAGKIQPGMNDDQLEAYVKQVKDAAAAAAKAVEDAKEKEKLAHSMQDMGNVEGITPAGIATEFKYDTTFGVATSPEEAIKQAQKERKDAEERQSDLEKNASEVAKQKEQRDKHNANAARLAGEQTKAQNEYGQDSDPNIVGSPAWQNAQATARSRVNSQAADSGENARIIKQFEEDAHKLSSFDKSTDLNPELIKAATRTVGDMHGALQAHAALLRQIVGLNKDIETLKVAQSILSGQIKNTPTNTLGF